MVVVALRKTDYNYEGWYNHYHQQKFKALCRSTPFSEEELLATRAEVADLERVIQREAKKI